MGRISKSLAEEVTRKLIAPIDKEIKALEKEKIEIARDYYKNLVPKMVQDCFDLHPEYFMKFSNWVHYGEYNSIGRVESKEFPEDNKTTSYSINQPKVVKVLSEIDLKLHNLEKKKRESYSLIYSSLIGLGTIKKIKEFMPEAGEFLPIEATTALSVNWKAANEVISQLSK
jgi:hypothetical protein